MKCANCSAESEGWAFVVLNANMGSDSLGSFDLTRHAPDETKKGFCSDTCLIDFLEAHPEEAKICVPIEETGTDYTYDVGCAHCEKKEGLFVAIHGSYGSTFDSVSRPAYFCSVRCIIDHVE